jgi:N utilization substance protein B
LTRPGAAIMKKNAIPERSAARLAAVQALYQMETGGTGVDGVIAEFIAHRLGGEIDDEPLHEADAEFFADIVRGVVEGQRRIDPIIERRLARNWTLGRIDSIARAILRAGVFELMRRADVPPRATIDEYVEIGKAFFDGEEARFINAVLDAVATEARPEDF